jgi:hypothetical protein
MIQMIVVDYGLGVIGAEGILLGARLFLLAKMKNYCPELHPDSEFLHQNK